MQTLVASALTCWLCTLIAIPRKPRFGNEVEEFVYSRLLGRQHRIAFLALLVTAITFVALVIGIPHAVQSDRSAVADTPRICAGVDTPPGHPTCYARRPGGTWVVDPTVTSPAWDPRLGIDPRIGNG